MELSSDSILIRGLLDTGPGQFLDSFHSPVLSFFVLFFFARFGNNHCIALFRNSAVRKMKLLSTVEIEM